MGSGNWSMTNTGTVWSVSDPDLTIYPQTSTILLSNTSSSATSKIFTGGGKNYNNLTVYGIATFPASLTINGANTFGTIAGNTSSYNFYGYTIKFGADQTVTDWTARGSYGANLLLYSYNAGVQRTITKTGGGVISTDYLTLKDMVGSPANTWYVGVNSVNNGNNSGFIYNNPPSGAAFFFL